MVINRYYEDIHDWFSYIFNQYLWYAIHFFFIEILFVIILLTIKEHIQDG